LSNFAKIVFQKIKPIWDISIINLMKERSHVNPFSLKI